MSTKLLSAALLVTCVFASHHTTAAGEDTEW
jgi:hypothetical protein